MFKKFLMATLPVLLFVSVCALASQYLFPIPSSESSPRHYANAITLYGAVEESATVKLIDGIQEANKLKTNAPLYLFIHSPGGDVMNGGMIIDAMEASRRPVYTICIGLCASMAAIIHQYGVKRYMFPHALLMFHNASTGMEDDTSHINSRMQMLNRYWMPFELHLAQITKLSLAEVKDHENNQWWLLPEDALTLHMIDGVTNANEHQIPR